MAVSATKSSANETKASAEMYLLENAKGETCVLTIEDHRVSIDGRGIHMTGLENTILRFLLERVGGRLVVRTTLMMYRHLYGNRERKDAPQLKIIDVIICKLRAKLDTAGPIDLLEDMWGRGHAFTEAGMRHRAPQLASSATRPGSVIGFDGAYFTLNELPLCDFTNMRWVVSRKAQIVCAVDGGMLSLDEACARYRLTAEEFLSWKDLMSRHGVAGLRTTRVNQYQQSV